MTPAAAGNVLLRLLYPRRAVCMGCESQAGFTRDWLCEDCRILLPKLWLGADALPEAAGFVAAAFAYHYAGPVEGMVRRLKYGGVTKLAGPMAADMARAYRAILPTGADVIAAVPMHRRRLKKRGFNHAELLGRGVGERLGLPVTHALKRTRNTRQQARLSRGERLKNLDGAFACDDSVKGRRVLLVDDVCTTGTTATGCAKALLDAGAAAVYLLCYARAGAGEK